MSDGELLKDLVRLAREEGLLEGEGLEAFVGALQERAQRIVEERLGSLEAEKTWRREAIRGLETENRWRREAMAGIESEIAWRREAMAALEREIAWRRETVAHLEDAFRALEARALELQTGRGEAERAHQALLEHHRKVLGLVVAELQEVASLPLVRGRAARRRLAALARLLGPEGS